MSRYLIKRCRHCGSPHNSASRVMCPKCSSARDRAYDAMGRRMSSDLDGAIAAKRSAPFRRALIRALGHSCHLCGWGAAMDPHVASCTLRLRRRPDAEIPDERVRNIGWQAAVKATAEAYDIVCPSCIVAQGADEPDERADYFIALIGQTARAGSARARMLLSVQKKKRSPAQRSAEPEGEPVLALDARSGDVDGPQHYEPEETPADVQPQKDVGVVHDGKGDDLSSLLDLIGG